LATPRRSGSTSSRPPVNTPKRISCTASRSKRGSRRRVAASSHSRRAGDSGDSREAILLGLWRLPRPGRPHDRVQAAAGHRCVRDDADERLPARA
jgi:hypothetical protein